MADSPKAFFISPFSAEAAGGEDQGVFEFVQDAVRSSAEAAGLALVRGDDIFEPGVVMDQVRSEIESADVVVAVCTGRNPNVFYELGMADMRDHRPILVARSKDDLPFDVGHLRAQLYGTDLKTLPERLEKAFRAALDATRLAPAVVAVPDTSHLSAIQHQKESFFRE